MSKNKNDEGILIEYLGRLKVGGYLNFDQMAALGELIGIDGEKFREQAVDDFNKHIGDI